MSWKIGMPNLGHTMEEGKVSEWLKAVGDPVSKGEVIAVVESDKASFDIESPADGILALIQQGPGSTVLVGASIGVVAAAGEVLDPDVQPVVAPATAGQTTAVPREAPPPATRAATARGRISPAARLLAEELGVDWQPIEGTGDGGMITRDDIRALSGATPADTAKPLSPMRRAIAEATQQAWRTIPHVPLQSHADVSSLVGASGISLTAAITRACALALGEHTAFNGWLIDNTFKPCRQSDIALLVATAAGLVTAVVRAAETKSIAELGDEIRALAASAKVGRLDGARMTGGSFSISSLGRWGVDAFTPIIAAPQVAILGVGRIDRVAREAPNGGVCFVNEIRLTLVFDHRANDGVEAARLLAAIVGYLEHPERLEKVL